MIEVEPALSTYSDLLFTQEKYKIDRSLLLQKENNSLSLILKDFLCLLSQFFLYEESHKILEYLLRNFQVHNYEAEELIVFFMHFHSTSYYTKLIQNVDLRKSKHFFFAAPNITKGEIISRDAIVKQIS